MLPFWEERSTGFKKINSFRETYLPSNLRLRMATWLSVLARIGFIGLVTTVPFRLRSELFVRTFPPIYKDYTYVLFFISDAFLLATLAFWALSFTIALPQSPARRVKTGPAFLAFPLVGLTLIAVFSTFLSIDPWLSAYHSLRLILLFGLYLYVINNLQRLEELVLPVALQILVQAGVGVAQVLEQRSLGLLRLGELELDPAWSGVSIVWSEGVRSLRAYGLTDHPNILGGCLAFALILLLAWYSATHDRMRSLAAGIFILGCLGLFFTFSRSAWLAFTVAVAWMAILWRKSRQDVPLARTLGLLGAAAIVLIPFLWQNLALLGVRFNWQNSFTQVPQEIQSIGEREILNQATNHIFAGNALTGVGLGALPLALRLAYPDFPVNYQPAHFVLLDVAAETGLAGALFYMLLLILPWLVLWFNRRRLVFDSFLIGASGLLLAVTLVGFFDYYPWFLAPGRLWQWLAWGLWGVAYTSAQREASDA